LGPEVARAPNTHRDPAERWGIYCEPGRPPSSASRGEKEDDRDGDEYLHYGDGHQQLRQGKTPLVPPDVEEPLPDLAHDPLVGTETSEALTDARKAGGGPLYARSMNSMRYPSGSRTKKILVPLLMAWGLLSKSTPPASSSLWAKASRFSTAKATWL
jgi:hypothetical protein